MPAVAPAQAMNPGLRTTLEIDSVLPRKLRATIARPSGRRKSPSEGLNRRKRTRDQSAARPRQSPGSNSADRDSEQDKPGRGGRDEDQQVGERDRVPLSRRHVQLKKSPHQVAWSIKRLASGPTMIQAQPRARPERSTQLGSAFQRPITMSVSHETATAHPAWCRSKTIPFATKSETRLRTYPAQPAVDAGRADQQGRLDRETESAATAATSPGCKTRRFRCGRGWRSLVTR